MAMPNSSCSFLGVFLTAGVFSCLLAAQAPTAKPDPDVLIFTDGEKLVGKFLRSAGASLTFKSDMVGEITVPWIKVKELHTAGRYAVIGKSVDLHKHADTSQIPQGVITATDQKIEVTPAPGQPAQTVPVADAGHIVDETAFQNAVEHNPRFFEAWKGALTGGAAFVEATQNSRTFTGSINLIRTIPTEDWLEPRNRTIFDFSAAYGLVTQPGSPGLKTEIYHGDAERDEYFSKRLFGFGQASFDHNFSQGLTLQQTYIGGIGLTVLKTDNQEFDVKAAASYARQEFAGTTAATNLAGASFGEIYNRKFPKNMLFVEQFSINAPFNITSDYSAVGSATFTMPFYKRLNLTAGTIDTFLNDPPAGFKKNSFQFSTGVSYSLK